MRTTDKFNEKDNEMVQLTKIILKQTARHTTAPPPNLTRLYYNGSAAKSHSTTTQYRQLRRLGPNLHLTSWARSIQPKFPEISVQNSMDRFGPTGKVSKKRVHLLRWSSFPGRTGPNFGWMDRAPWVGLLGIRVTSPASVRSVASVRSIKQTEHFQFASLFYRTREARVVNNYCGMRS